MRFDLTDLRVFLQATDCGSMPGAAERSHLTLAAVSARLRALEQTTGVALLHRHARGVAATPAGEVLARHARLVLQQLESLRRDLAPSAGAQANGPSVVLGNSAALARPLGGAVAAALAGYPYARIVLRESASEVAVQALHAGAADLGIVSDAAAIEGLDVEPLGDDPLLVVGPSAHPAIRAGETKLAPLLEDDWIVWGHGAALHTHLQMQAHRSGGTLRVRAVVPSAAEVVSLAVSGAGIAVLPAALAGPVPSSTARTAVLDEPWARRRLVLVRRPGPSVGVIAALREALLARWAAFDRPAG